jgi:hypothetical protein
MMNRRNFLSLAAAAASTVLARPILGTGTSKLSHKERVDRALRDQPPLCSSHRFHVNSVSGDEDEATGKDYHGLSIPRRSSPGGGSAQVTREGTGGACPERRTRTFSPAFSGEERIYSTCPIKGW